MAPYGMASRARTSRGGAALIAVLLAVSACGGETGERAKQAAEDRARSELDKAEKRARKEAAERAKVEIDKLERQAKREVRENADKEIERAAERAKREVDKTAK